MKKKDQIEAQLHKYKHYKDFDRINSMAGHEPRNFFTHTISSAFYMSILAIPLGLHRYFRIHYSRKVFLLNVWKVFLVVGSIFAVMWKSDACMRVFERNPYGNLTAAVCAYKHLSYSHDMYQNVKVIKEKYNDQTIDNQREVKKSYTKRREPYLYAYFVNYLREFPQDGFK